MSANLTHHFDSQWYLDEYPDVQLSGMDPYEHYLWLGWRLNRKTSSKTAINSSFTATDDCGASDRYDELAIAHALQRLCAWIAPPSEEGSGALDASAMFERMEADFGGIHIDGVPHVNPNARKLVDLIARCDDTEKASFISHFPDRQQDTDSILLASYYAPTRMHAGGLRLLDAYSLIRERSPNVHLTLFAPRHDSVDGDISNLNKIFDEIHFCRPEQFRPDWLLGELRPGQRFALADLQFHQAGVMARQLRSIAKRLIFTPMEALSRFAFDEVRDKALDGELAANRLFALIHDGVREAEIMDSVDMTVCVSDADAAFLAQLSTKTPVNYFPTGLSLIEFSRELSSGYSPLLPPGKYNRLVFSAYFGSETNRIGLQWFLEEVHPRIISAVPDYELAVVGRGDTTALERLAKDNVCFIGEVPNLAPVLEQAKAGLVLARNGSGFRGKINQYALCGLPTISTHLGATGLSYEDGKDIVLADGAVEFANACISLLTDDAQASQLAAAARRRALDHYSWGSIWPRIAAIYGLDTVDANGKVGAR